MTLKVLLPTHVMVEREVSEVTAEAENGSFTILPRHIDFVSILTPGLLSYQVEEEGEIFLAVDEGVLVKCGSEVRVSTQDAVMGDDLQGLRDTVERRFRDLDERQRKAKGVLMRIELDLARRFYEVQKSERG
jgi:F-type H+-transporting ATPase subunit epsilon